MGKVRHVLGISGGKDSAALAIYMKNKYNLNYFEPVFSYIVPVTFVSPVIGFGV